MPTLAEQARKQQLARDLAEARDSFERTNFVVAEPDAEAPTLPGKGNKKLELLLKQEWLSRVRGVCWSGTDDELKRAFEAEKQKRRTARSTCDDDDGARRVQERRESATQRAAQNATQRRAEHRCAGRREKRQALQSIISGAGCIVYDEAPMLCRLHLEALDIASDAWPFHEVEALLIGDLEEDVAAPPAPSRSSASECSGG